MDLIVIISRVLHKEFFFFFKLTNLKKTSDINVGSKLSTIFSLVSPPNTKAYDEQDIF